MSEENQRNFGKFASIPLQPGPTFEEQLVLLDRCAPFFGKAPNAVAHWQEWCKLRAQFSDEKSMQDWITQLKGKVVNFVRQTPGYQRLMNDDLKRFAVRGFPEKYNIYDPSNNGKTFISVDLRKANMQALNEYDPSILQSKTYEDFIKQFTKIPCLVESRYFRLLIFSFCESNKLAAIQRFILMRELNKILPCLTAYGARIIGSSNDEFILAVDSGKYDFLDVLDHSRVRVTKITLKMIELNIMPKGKLPFDVMSLEYQSGKGQFGTVASRKVLCLPSYLTCQVYRQMILKETPTVSDRRGYVDQFPCVLDPVILKSTH